MSQSFINISLLILCFAAFSFAQKGAISGTVTDNFGARIPGTQIEFVGDKGTSFYVSTNAAGEYRIELDSGLYKVIASRRPFTNLILTDYSVPQRSLKLDIVLQCVECEVLECPLAEPEIVKMGIPMIDNELRNRPLEKLPSPNTSKEKVRKTKKKINEQFNIWNH